MNYIVGIYKIENIVNNKVYIGQSTNIKKRFNSHKATAFNINSKYYNYHLYKSIRKYGLKSFTFEIVEKCKKTELNEKEKYRISFYNSTDKKRGYNISIGGRNGHFFKLNQEILDDITKMLMNGISQKYISKKYNLNKDTISLINIGKLWYREDLKYPLYKKIKQEKTKMNRKRVTELDNMNYDELITEIKQNDYNFTKLSKKYNLTVKILRRVLKDKNIPCFSKEFKKEFKPYISDKDIKKPKKVIQKQMNGEILNIYTCASQAALSLGNKNKERHITEVCKKQRKSAYGYIWEFFEDEN